LAVSASTPGTRDARRVVVGASVSFAVVLTALALLVFRLRRTALASVFDPATVAPRSILGACIGLAAGTACLLVVSHVPRLAGLRRLARDAIAGIEPRWHTIVIVAAAAGWSEELLFRGALQPVAGPWITAVLFVALHGALRIRGARSLAFALFLALASLGLSALKNWKGLEAAMVAHATYDVAVLVGLVEGARAPRSPD
jgi:CAAX protease family protein